MNQDAASDLDAYLARIEYDDRLAVDPGALFALHLAHATHIPFENLDILLGRAIRLDPSSLAAKLVHGGRGGYCFEQNLLFASMLERIGFDVTMLAARVRYRTTRTLPRTHMLLEVQAGGRAFLVDVGFGGAGLLLPVPLEPGAESTQFAWRYRLIPEGRHLVLQTRAAEDWQDLYAFTGEPQLPVDFEVANHYVSTHPQSRFVRTLAVQLPGPEVRRTVRNRTFIVEGRDAEEMRTIATDPELLETLAREFGLTFPPGTRFPFDETFPA